MVQHRHIERPAVAHVGEGEAQREIEGGGPSVHLPENPVLDLGDVAVEIFRDREFSRHGLAVQETQEEVARLPLRVVDTIALQVEAPCEPIGTVDQPSGERAAWMASVDRREIGTEREIRSRNVRMEVVGLLRETPASYNAIGIGVTEGESPGSAAAAALVLDHVDIDVEAVGPHHSDATGQLLARSVAGGYASHLVLRAEIVVVEHVVADR